MDVFDSLPASAPKRFRALFLLPVFERPVRLIVVFISLVFLSLSQSSVLLLIGPLFKSLFDTGLGERILVQDLLPQVLSLGSLGQWEISRQDLVFGVPTALLIAVIVKACATYFFQYNQQAVAFHVAKRYRDRLFASVLKLPYVEITEKAAGEWMSLVMNDVLYLQSRFSEIVSSIIKDSALIISAFAVMLLLHWPTALFLMFLSPFVLVYLGRKGKTISSYADAWQRRLADMSSRILSLRQRFNFIRAQQGEQRELQLFRQLNDDYYKLIRKSIYLRSVIGPGIEYFGVLVFALFLYLIANKLYLQDMEPTELIQFLSAMALLLKPLKVLGEQFARIQETVGALKEGMQIFERTSALGLPREGLKDTRVQNLSFNKMSCGYIGQERFFAESLSFEAGTATAVVGPSGAGKSTLIKTLVGLLEPISWDGNHSWLECASNTSFVSQNPFLFSDSIRGNLCYGLEEVPPDDELWALLDKVGLKSTLIEMKSGLDSSVEAVRSNFSGGQVQRLVLCRSLLQKKQILVLDEATSAIDAATEGQVNELVIKRCHEENTILLSVTHRMNYLAEFDQILFVEEGKILLKGKYNDLLKEERFKAFLQDARD